MGGGASWNLNKTSYSPLYPPLIGLLASWTLSNKVSLTPPPFFFSLPKLHVNPNRYRLTLCVCVCFAVYVFFLPAVNVHHCHMVGHLFDRFNYENLYYTICMSYLCRFVNRVCLDTTEPLSYSTRYRRKNSGVNKVAWLEMTDWSTASNVIQLTVTRNSYKCKSGYVTRCTKELSCHDNGHYMLQCTHALFLPLGLDGIATDLCYIQVHGIAPRNKPSRLSLSVSVSTNDQLDRVSLMIDWIVFIYIYIQAL